MSDIQPDMGYNIANNDNDTWESQVGDTTISGKVVERIQKSDLTPITVTGCKHLRTERDASEETEHYYGVHCLDCPIGWLIRKEAK